MDFTGGLSAISRLAPAPARRHQLPDISINLSAIQIRNHHFLAEVKQALADYQLQSEHLELEITENAFNSRFRPRQ